MIIIEEGRFYKTRSGHRVEALKKYKNGDTLFWDAPGDDCFIIYSNNKYNSFISSFILLLS